LEASALMPVSVDDSARNRTEPAGITIHQVKTGFED